jgi:hypothetical protein
MNDPFVAQQAREAAKKLLEAVAPDAERVRMAYRRALGRDVTKQESERAVGYVNQSIEAAGGDDASRDGRDVEAWTSFYQALFASAEFRYR